MSFVHLRLHTEYSLVDSTIRIKQLMPVVEEGGMPAVAMTDQNNLFGMVKFYRAARGAGIKPIFGVDVMLVDEEDDTLTYHMILLCQNDAGYKNVTKLISRAYMEGQKLGVPRVQRDWIKETSDGVIMLSGGRQGDVGHALLAGNKELAQKLINDWKSVFPDRYYVELQRTGRAGENEYLHAAVALAAENELPVVATNDARFLTQDDFEAHEARVCINSGYTLDDKTRPKHYSDQQYLRSAAEMEELFSDIPEALENTIEIAKRCNVELTLGKNYLPEFPIPEGMTEGEFFAQESVKGLEERWPHIFDESVLNNPEEFAEKRKPYDERLQVELDVINGMGFPGYFLIVADFIQWSKDNDIPVGPGRGSGAGSLVAYALKITDIDPLLYDLLFERFLNPERVSMPDFDIDFCMDKREKTIEYVAEKYGRDKVSQIITYGSMAAKAVVRDCGRILNHPYGFVDRIAKLIPFEMKMTLTKAMDQEPDLKDLYEQDEEVKALMDLALKLEGLTRNAGKHAGGVLISPSSLVDFTPLYCEEGGSIVSQFDKDDVEAVGLVKFDFLGLRNLTIIDWAVKSINTLKEKKGEAPIRIEDIPLDDQASFDLLRAAKTTAVFQLESHGMKELIKRLQPDVFEDIIALVALYRPGPLQSGMVDDFVARKKGDQKVTYQHPDLEPLLNTTYGVIVYQEQVMQIAQVLAGYSLGGADMLRRAMGKKKPEEMAKQREIFMEGSAKNNVEPANATEIFDLMELFAEYGFNKSHSAAYALVSYQTIWLKAHYPAAFMAAVLSADMDNTEKVVTFVDDCLQFGLDVVAPDINRSHYRFISEDEGNVIFGLGAIKGAGESAIAEIIEERDKNGPFKSMAEMCQRVKSRKISKRILETLIRAGAFDKLGTNRRSLMEGLPEIVRIASQQHRDDDVGQNDLFGGSIAVEQDEKVTPHLEEWDEKIRLRYEKDAIGLYITGHPINAYQEEVEQLRSRSLKQMAEDDGRTRYSKKPITLVGLVSAIRTQTTDRGKRAFVTLDDKTSYYEIFIFSNVYEQYEDLIKKEEVLVVEGSLNSDYATGAVRLRIEALHDIQSARNSFLRRLTLSVDKSQTANGLLDKLDELLPTKTHDGEAGGQCPVFISYETDSEKAELRLGPDVSAPLADEDIKLLKKALGDDRVNLVY
ncbi:DNA polymerase III subunit alpha [Cocleimonas sp. KMM 6892]|uniref:DNA polymerase III subunit alpha n=1 Tax=unclassified Cocleimonas TaxID=2639732 RepID=UPI002DC03962|nr:MULTISPECIES: DNA polymerase III subunit alpha [unclassified Cocleimonas]MEB8431008.1 DNA polymerase III subunit alpha [Cocleimonas sp. KMM 6892]MEC4714220.1 DNA polymerase III subunit alpha [Cocleimonas sp. KMM 6895]MEC4743551.1 DNA polymerase III subunit alpha [Cocleimonas sp. KMM 6896]